MSDKQSILVITPYFAPETHPRAHRWSAICSAWAEEGHDVTVICGKLNRNVEVGTRNHAIYRAGHASLKNKYFKPGTQSAHSSTFGIKKWLSELFIGWIRPRLLPDEAMRLFVPKAQKLALETCANKNFTLLVTVSKPFSTHLIGVAIKKQFPDLNWIADCGDPWVAGLSHAVPRDKLDWAIALEKSTLAEADLVCVTSDRLANLFKQEYQLTKVAVIPPLLEVATAMPHIGLSKETPEEILTICYFGALYAPERTGEIIIAWCKAFKIAAPELAQRTKIKLYGTIQPALLSRLDTEPMIEHLGQIQKNEMVEHVQAADVLLNVGNQVDFLLPSKLVEYVSYQKPILHLGYFKHDACTDFLSAWSHAWMAGIMRDEKFAEGDMKNTIPFLLGSQARQKANLASFTDTFNEKAIASAYLNAARAV
jgi:hypothetical protein